MQHAQVRLHLHGIRPAGNGLLPVLLGGKPRHRAHPRGHPLYDYIDTYGDTIRKYLGEFATLKSTNDIANHICQIHDAYTATQQPSELESIVSDASSLVYTAYQLVGSSPDLTNDTRRQINTAISAVQTLLSLSPIDYTSLEGAVSNLRSQLQAAGLM